MSADRPMTRPRGAGEVNLSDRATCTLIVGRAAARVAVLIQDLELEVLQSRSGGTPRSSSSLCRTS